jgi:hypothetical protein
VGTLRKEGRVTPLTVISRAHPLVRYHIPQPPGTNVCGQCCVAMLANITLDQACEIIGHRHITGTREMARALRNLGYLADGRLTRIYFKRGEIMRVKQQPCKVGIIKAVPRYSRVWKRHGHFRWVVKSGSKICDPGLKAPVGLTFYIENVLRLTAFMEVRLKERKVIRGSQRPR